MDYRGGDNTDLVPCRICDRRFSPEALARHEPICKKTQTKKRRVFDSSKQRADGTEIMAVKKKGPPAKMQAAPSRPTEDRRRTGNAAEPPVKKNNWRQKHEEFVRTIRAARGVQAAMDRGEPLPPPPPPSINPDYIQCDYCGRRFAESAADRHIQFCKEQHERLPKKKPDHAVAAQKMAVRTQYQPPRLKKSGGPTGPSTAYRSSDDMYSSPTPAPSQTRAGGSSGYGVSRQRGGGTGGGAGRGGGGGAGGGGGYSGAKSTVDYSRSDGPVSGQALRTGRTVETYSEARKLSAKQRAAIPSKKYPSSDNIHSYSNSSQYTGTGYVGSPSGPAGGGYRGSGSKPGSGRAVSQEESWNNNNTYGATYGYGSPGTVPRGRGAASRPGNTGSNTTVSSAGRFCYDCGAKFPLPSARFCCECGLPRQS